MAVAMMPAVDVQERYDAGRAMVLAAGALAASYFARLDDLRVTAKGVQDVVTQADVEVERLLARSIAERFPDDAFLGEETGAAGLAGSRGVWVVDPIDGTQPFVSGLASWCVSVAYVHDGVLQFGFVHNPPLGELFEGGVGRPALLNGTAVTPHAGRAVTDGLVALGYAPRIPVYAILPVMERLLRNGGVYYRNGSGALMLCYVACGRLLGYIEPHLNSWDCLGALAVAQAAGARTNDYLTGDALLAGNRIVAGPPAVYDALDAILGPATRP
jgi:myo-inositol-1(or 4)-monophosphatase